MRNFIIEDISRIIEMAWENRTPFEAIELQFGLKENDVREIMKREMKPSAFKMERKRVRERVRVRKTKYFLVYSKKEIRLKPIIKKSRSISTTAFEMCSLSKQVYTLLQIKSIQHHNFIPSRNKVFNKFLFVFRTSIKF